MITPQILIHGFLLFMGCLLAHIILWRWRIPEHDAFALFVLFLAVPAVICTATVILWERFLPYNGTQLALVFILHASLSSVYIASYPAAQAISPSLDILLLIAASPEKRMSEQEIDSQYDDTRLVTARIDDLRRSVLVSERDAHFTLTASGRALIAFFILYRKALGLPAGEG